MIKDNMVRIQITLSKAQAEWLENMCKKAGISKSKYISWTLVKSAEELLKILRLNSVFGNYTEEQIYQIAKCKWLDD